MAYASDTQLSRYTAEFISRTKEETFQRVTWNHTRKTTRNVLLVSAFLVISFFIRDLMETDSSEKIYLLLATRLTMMAVILASAIYMHRATAIFKRFFSLLLLNQLLIVIMICILAVVRMMPFAYLGVNTIIFTLISYQFLFNQFRYTVFACCVMALAALATSIIFLAMDTSGFIASILFLIPLNLLGIWFLKSNNRIRRREFIARSDLEEANSEKEKVIKDLQEALDEVKTLRNFLPICASCKKIRDDEGYWNRIDVYLKKHADVEISHGLCPDCTRELYGDQKWFKGSKLKDLLDNS